jgi:hypothetical protein
MKRQWQRFKDWWAVNRYSKRGLSVGEVFFRLAVWQRWILIVCCLLIAALWISPVYCVSVLPHWYKLHKADGSFDVHEFSLAVGLTGTVFFLAIYEFIWKSRDVTFFWKAGGLLTVVLCVWTNVGTGTVTQTHGQDERNNAARAHNERIAWLDKEIENNTTAWQTISVHKVVTQATINTIEKAAKDLEKSAYDECHTGLGGWTRGKNCDALEKKRDAKLEELAKAQADKDLTDRANGIELALTQLKNERKELRVLSLFCRVALHHASDPILRFPDLPDRRSPGAP